MTSAVNAYALGWLDDTSYLANTYAPTGNLEGYQYHGAVIYDLSGTVQ